MKERYLLEEEVGENGFSLITDYDGNDEHARTMIPVITY